MIAVVHLPDQGDVLRTSDEVKVTIEDDADIGFSIRFEGYGDCATIAGEGGTPLHILFENGKLMLYCYADINQEEPTHVIDLEGARDALYKGDGS